MALNDPIQPNKNNQFDKYTSSVEKMFTGMEEREKATNEKLDKLIKQMVLYYKLLETSYNKDKISSKKGREESLNNDKGFLKLLDLMTQIDNNFRKTLDNYVAGNRLQLSEKKDLAKFVQNMNDALIESKEQIGIPVKDILNNFKKIIKDEKINNDFKLNLFSFLREYSEEDLALSKELKNLLDDSVKYGKISDDRVISILMELDKNIEHYTDVEKDYKTATFAPYKKLDGELQEANLNLEEVVKLLTENQRSNNRIEEQLEDQSGKGDKKDGALSFLEKEMRKTTADLADFATVMVGKTAGLGMAENPWTRGASPYVFAGSEMAGKAVGGAVQNFNAGDVVKLRALAPLAPYILGAGAVAVGAGALGVAANKYGDYVKSKQTGGMYPTGGKITDTFNSGRDYGKHNAIDLAQPYGSNVKSALGGGTVTKVGEDKLSGKYVFVKNPKGTTESFAHLSQANVKMGDVVPASGVVGLSGTTGRVSGVGQGQSVLHYKVRDAQGNPVDPQKVVPAYSESQKKSTGSSKQPTIWEQRQKFMSDASNVDTAKLALSNKGGTVDTTNYDNFKNKYNMKNITMDKDGNYKVLASDKKTGEVKSFNASDVLTYDVNGQNKWVKNPQDFMNIGNSVSAMPEPITPTAQTNTVASNQPQILPVPINPSSKMDRKLKSDNDLLNHYIDYGDIG